MTLAVEDSKTKLVDIIALADVGDIDTRMRTEDIHPQVSAIFSELKS